MGRTGPGLQPITGPRRIYLPTTSAADRIVEIRQRTERPRRVAAIIEAALRDAGMDIDSLPEDQKSALDRLSQDELDTLASIRAKLNEEPEVSGHMKPVQNLSYLLRAAAVA